MDIKQKYLDEIRYYDIEKDRCRKVSAIDNELYVIYEYFVNILPKGKELTDTNIFIAISNEIITD